MKCLVGICLGFFFYTIIQVHAYIKMKSQFFFFCYFFRNSCRYTRNSRSTISDYFIMPGTRWCGPDDQASKYGNLGEMSRTDQCCRKHDHCKLNIHGFTKKFGYYNPKPFTLSHCYCDKRYGLTQKKKFKKLGDGICYCYLITYCLRIEDRLLLVEYYY